jgi:hypothetical protein
MRHLLQLLVLLLPLQMLLLLLCCSWHMILNTCCLPLPLLLLLASAATVLKARARPAAHHLACLQVCCLPLLAVCLLRRQLSSALHSTAQQTQNMKHERHCTALNMVQTAWRSMCHSTCSMELVCPCSYTVTTFTVEQFEWGSTQVLVCPS